MIIIRFLIKVIIHHEKNNLFIDGFYNIITETLLTKQLSKIIL